MLQNSGSFVAPAELGEDPSDALVAEEGAGGSGNCVLGEEVGFLDQFHIGYRFQQTVIVCVVAVVNALIAPSTKKDHIPQKTRIPFLQECGSLHPVLVPPTSEWKIWI